MSKHQTQGLRLGFRKKEAKVWIFGKEAARHGHPARDRGRRDGISGDEVFFRSLYAFCAVDGGRFPSRKFTTVQVRLSCIRVRAEGCCEPEDSASQMIERAG